MLPIIASPASLLPLAATILLFSMAPSPISAQTPPAPATAAPKVASASALVKGNRFTIELSPTTIRVGEPVDLRIRIENPQGDLIVGNYSGRMFMAEGNDLDVRVAAPGQLPQRYIGPEEPGIFAGGEINLDRDESSLQEYSLLFERNTPTGLLFDTVGDYLVTARLQGSVYREKSQEIVVLPPTKITVLPADTEEHQQALNALNDKALIKALHLGLTSNQEILQKLRAFVGRFPKSSWTPQALTVIANDQMFGNTPNYAAAARMYMEIATRFPNSARAPGAWFTAAQAYQKLGDDDSVRALYYLLKDLYPAYPLLRKETPLAFRMEFGPQEFLSSRPYFHYNRPYTLQPREKEEEIKP